MAMKNVVMFVTILDIFPFLLADFRSSI